MDSDFTKCFQAIQHLSYLALGHIQVAHSLTARSAQSTLRYSQSSAWEMAIDSITSDHSSVEGMSYSGDCLLCPVRLHGAASTGDQALCSADAMVPQYTSRLRRPGDVHQSSQISLAFAFYIWYHIAD